MKLFKLTLSVLALSTSGLALAQSQTYVNNSGYITGDAIYTRKAESEKATGTQYFNENFTLAQINADKTPVLVRYNAYTDELEVKVNDEIRILQPSSEVVVQPTNAKYSYEYVQYINKEKVETQTYLMLISDNPNLKIYKKESVYLQPEQHPTGGYQKYKAPAYKKRDAEYYIKIKDGSVVYFEADKTGVMSLFPEKKNEIKDFMKENKISPSDEDDLPKLGAYLNTIL